MIKCPECGQWTLEFDDYFGRLRCFNPECLWMPSSSAKRAIRLFRAGKEPKQIIEKNLKNISWDFKVYYDAENDVLSFDFDINEQTIEMPEPDGKFVWKISKDSGAATGFYVLDAKKRGVEKVEITALIISRKKVIEKLLQMHPDELSTGKTSKLLIKHLSVTTKSSEDDINNTGDVNYKEIVLAVEEALSKFDSIQGNTETEFDTERVEV